MLPQCHKLTSLFHSTTDLRNQTTRLQKQYAELMVSFHGPSAVITSSVITTPNDPSFAEDFARATQPKSSSRANKSVRFRDNPDAEEDDTENRTALFQSGGQERYRDDPSDSTPSQDDLSNQQIHQFHKQVLRDQDDQLDTLGQSIRRQRTLGIQMGEELDDQVQMLDDVEAGVDRHQSTLDRAQTRLKGVAKKAKDNWSWVTIACLMLILVLLIALT